MPNMLQTSLEYGNDVLVLQRIQHMSSLSIATDDASDPQQPQLVRHRRHGQAKQRSQIADA